ncbi:MAG: oligosaccharide flippase family protein, partial [Rhodospirillaceae bacterium]|nr:oligosaccharide flippase family protein [Rhodospirillaceae bacterium]
MTAAEDVHAKIRKRAVRVFPSSAGGVALATALAIVFARWMGIGQFGAFAFTYHAIRLMALFGSLGFSQIALRYVPRYHRDGHAGLLSGFMRVGLGVTLLG